MIHGLRALAAAMLLVLAGCAVTGHDFQASNLSSLTPGQTTMAQAAYILAAAPDTIYPQSDGTTLAVWRYKASIITDAAYARQEATLQFGPDGRLIRLVDTINVPLMPSTRRKLLGVEPPPAPPAPAPVESQAQPAAASMETGTQQTMMGSPLSTGSQQTYTIPIPATPTPMPPMQ